jgi:hypothetical protein
VALIWSLLRRRDIWQRIGTERLTEPLHLNLLALPVAAFGNTRAKIAFDLLVRHSTPTACCTAPISRGLMGSAK